MKNSILGKVEYGDDVGGDFGGAFDASFDLFKVFHDGRYLVHESLGRDGTCT